MLQPQQNDAWKRSLGVFTPEGLADHLAQRRRMLDRLEQAGIQKCSQGTKLHTGRLSQGCDHCRYGTWSCLYINGRCSASCIFCPQDREIEAERPPVASAMVFNDPNLYLGFLVKFGYKGVGISGGEPFLVFDRLIDFVRTVREGLKDETYIWLYTNGKHITKDRLRALRRAGLDEIRLNLSVHRYSTDIVPTARKALPVVSVEVPALIEDVGRLKDMADQLSRLGVDHLNLHQLHATEANHRRLPQGLHFFPSQSRVAPNAESDLAALRILEHVLVSRSNLSVNYCSQRYKRFFQGRATRSRVASVVCAPYEWVTEAGYLRTVILNNRDDIEKGLSVLTRLPEDPKRWHYDREKGELGLHPDLALLLEEAAAFTLRYEWAFVDHSRGEFFAPADLDDISIRRRVEYETPPLYDLKRLMNGNLPAATARFEHAFFSPGAALFGGLPPA